jgi:hypothetical protein
MQPCALGQETAQIVEFVPEIKGYNRWTLPAYFSPAKTIPILLHGARTLEPVIVR